MSEQQPPDHTPYQYGSEPSPTPAPETQQPATDQAAPGQVTPGQDAPAAQATNSMSAEDVKQKFAAVGITNPLPQMAAAGAAYVTALIMSVICLLLVAVGQFMSSSGSGSSPTDRLGADKLTGDSFNGITALIGLPFQIVSLGALGSYGFTDNFQSIGMNIRFIPLLVTIALVAVSFFGARFAVRRSKSQPGILGMLVNSVCGGLSCAIVVVVLARIAGVSLDTANVNGTLHAASFSAFFGALFLVGGGLLLGQLAAKPAPAWLSRWTEFGAAARLALVHALAVIVIVGGAAVLWSVIDTTLEQGFLAGLAGIFYIPLLLGLLAAGSLSVAMLGGYTATGGLGAFGISRSGSSGFGLFDLPWYCWILVFLVDLILLVAVSLLWQSGRRLRNDDPMGLLISVIALPLMYFVGGVLVLIVGSASFAVQAGPIGGGAGWIHPSLWLPFMAMLVGILVELLARFGAPFVLPYIPAALVSWFRRAQPQSAVAAGEGVSASADAPSALAGTPAATAFSGDGAAPAADTTPIQPAKTLSPRARQGIIIGAISAAALLVLLIGSIIAVKVISSTVYGPEAQVDAYLNAVESGNYGTAVELAQPNVENANKVLLSDAIGKATKKRADGHTIDDVTVTGDHAEVTATITRDGKRDTRTFVLSRTGSTMLFFPTWTLQDGMYSDLSLVVSDSQKDLTVNGVKIDLSKIKPAAEDEGYKLYRLPALPGTYELGGKPSSEFLTMEPATAEIGIDPTSVSEESHAVMKAQLSDKGRQEILAQVKQKLDECQKSTSAEPEGCPFHTYVFNQQEGTKGSWKITKYPTVTIEPSYNGGWRISSNFNSGKATYSYTALDWTNTVQAKTDDTSIIISGKAEITSDGKIEVTLRDF